MGAAPSGSPVVSWNEQLRFWRRELGLGRAELAFRAALSAETVKSLELGRRKPSREVLVAVLDALRVDRLVRNQILEAAGFKADGLELAPHNAGFFPSLDAMADAVAEVPWPAFVTNELFEVVAVNRPYLNVVGVRDFLAERPEPLDRNLLSALGEARFAAQIDNWDECSQLIIALMKGHHRGCESEPEHFSTYYAAVLEHFLDGDPQRVSRFLELWDSVPAQSPRARFTYPITWRLGDGRLLHFLGLSHEVNSRDGLNYHDWVPVDEDTWRHLRSLSIPSVAVEAAGRG